MIAVSAVGIYYSSTLNKKRGTRNTSFHAIFMKNIRAAAIGFFDGGFFSSSSIIFVGSFVVNALNYVFTIIVSRLMGVEEFGEVAALLSLFLIISVPASAVAMLMSREAAFRSVNDHGSIRDLFLFLRKHVLAAGLGVWVIFLALTPLLSHLLHIPYIPFFIFSMLAPLALIGSLQSGALQGLQEFFLLAKQNILSTLVKLGASILLVLAGLSVPGVMLALVLASCSGLVYGFFATRAALGGNVGPRESTIDRRSIRSLFSVIFITTLMLALLSNIDVLLAKHFLPTFLAGQYGALSAVGKIIIYGVGAFVTVLLPFASAAHARGDGGDKRILGLSLFAIGVSAFAAWALFSVFPELVVSILFGARYVAIAASLGTFAIAMGCIALSTALINYFVAIRNTSFVYLLMLAIAAEIALISFDHGSVEAVTRMLVVSSVLLLSLMCGNYFFTAKKISI